MSKDGSYEPAKIPSEKMCEQCNTKFTPKSWQYRNQRFCSKGCMYSWRKSKGERVRICKCGNRFNVGYPSNPQKWCGIHCIELLKQTEELSKQRFIKNNPMNNPIHKLTQAKNSGKSISKLELMVVNTLKNRGVVIETQFSLGTFSFDIFVPNLNLLIEVNGDYWHCNPKKYQTPINDIQLRAIKRDKRKKNLAKSNGFKLLTIWEQEINDGKLNQILQEHIYICK